MTRDAWLELTVLEKKKYNYLIEIEDLTKQLGQSLDRNDQVSTRMLVAMRQDPLRQLEEIDKGERIRLSALSEAEQERVRALRQGDPPRDADETVFLTQAGKTRRLLEQVVELDRRISLRMAGEHSFYQK